jgi:hypothetical protein
MRRLAFLLLVGCRSAHPSVDAGAPDDATVRPMPAPQPSHPLRSSAGHLKRQVNFIDGTGITTAVVDNDTTGQADVTVASTVTGGVSSVTGSSGVSCSPTTGAVACTNTGATSVTGAGSTSCSPTTGAVTCTTSNSVSNGLTGVATLTNHAVLLGAGTSAINSVGPDSAVGRPLLSQGSSADPSFGTLTVPYGGTGDGAFTLHGVVIGENTSALNATSAGTAGQVLTSNGSGADPSFQAPASTTKLYANVSGSTFTIGTSLASCVTVASVVVASGQSAYVTAMAWVVSTDGATLHNVDLNVTNVTNSGTGQVGQVDLGGTGGLNGDATLAGENIDNSVGTFTYAAQLLRTGTLATGTVTAHWCSIQAIVQ